MWPFPIPVSLVPYIHLGPLFNDPISCHLNAIVDRYLSCRFGQIFKSTSRPLVSHETGRHLMGPKLQEALPRLDLARLGQTRKFSPKLLALFWHHKNVFTSHKRELAL